MDCGRSICSVSSPTNLLAFRGSSACLTNAPRRITILTPISDYPIAKRGRSSPREPSSSHTLWATCMQFTNNLHCHCQHAMNQLSVPLKIEVFYLDGNFRHENSNERTNKDCHSDCHSIGLRCRRVGTHSECLARNNRPLLRQWSADMSDSNGD